MKGYPFITKGVNSLIGKIRELFQLTSVSIIVLAIAVTINADTISLLPSADAITCSGAPNTNYGTGTSPCPKGNLGVGADDSSTCSLAGIYHTYAKYDMSAIPAGSTIDSATLRWVRMSYSFMPDHTPYTVLIQTCASSWTESVPRQKLMDRLT